jgi:predicted RNA-binding Zn-ribbon protein involved in translation (DUF1610 family)
MTCEFKLIRHNGPHPPGGFPFQDPKTGRKFSGSEGGIRDTVERVLQHRLSNPIIFTNAALLDFEHILEEVDCYQCLRLGNPSQYCTNGKSGSPKIALRVVNKFCPECGTMMTERYCPTCSSRKLVGYNCGKCGKEFST